MDKNVNPWTGKTKSSKNVGLLNQILFKYYPQLERPPLPNPYLEYIPIIQSQINEKNVEDFTEIFDIKTKINKINEIMNWIDKVEQLQRQKKVEEQVPINSSFVYIPVHSYNTFHEILKQCSGLGKEAILKDEVVSNIKKQIKQMEQILQLNHVLMTNIL